MKTQREMIERDEFRTPVSPNGIEFVQVTSRERQTGWLEDLYVTKWTPDSKKFILRREAAEDGSSPNGIWVCDTEDDFSISPVVEFPDGTAGACLEKVGRGGNIGTLLLPDGSGVVHVHHVGDTFEVRKTSLDGSDTEVILTSPATIATRWMTQSADSERVALGVFLGDGKTEGAPWGTRVFDIKHRKWWDIELGNQFRRGAGQYTYMADPEYSHYIVTTDPGEKMSDGSWLTPPDGYWRWENLPEQDPHLNATVVYHDVTGKWGTIPIGCNGSHVNSHGTWRGANFSYVAAMYHTSPNLWRAPFIEAEPVQCEQAHWYDGHRTPGANIVDLSRETCRADACHFGFDIRGKYLVSDTDGYVNPGPNLLYVATRFEPENEEPYVKTKLLGITRTSWRWKSGVQMSHPHPNLSPDGKFAAFQSDFFDRPQVFVAHSFEFPE